MRTTAVTPTASQIGERRRRRAFFALLLFAALGGTSAAYIFREEIQDGWALNQFRRAAANDGPSLADRRERLRERLLRTEESLDLAVPLATDPDPKVRVAAVELLLADQPKVKKQDTLEELHASARGASWRVRVAEAIELLLKDPDPTVRQTALRAVSELDWADQFRAQLTDAVRNGTPADRLIVAGHLGHWNGPLLAEVIGDADQAIEIRIAAMRGIGTYGERAIAAYRGELREALVAALKSQNAEARVAAIVALRHAQRGVDVWLDVLCDANHKDLFALVLRTWIDALGSGAVRIWSDSHEAWFHGTSNAVRCGVATYALCEGAKLQMRRLDTEPPIPEVAALQDRQGPTGRAFDTQLTRLGYVLSVASAACWYCDTIDRPPEFAAWLPHETPDGAPPKRSMKAYLFQQAKPAWEWCLNRRDGYQTRFLTTNSIVKGYRLTTALNPVSVRPLGAVMDDLGIGSAEFGRLVVQYDNK